MTYDYFKQHWQNDCLKDGVLTIPDGIEELYQNCGIAGNNDIRKVVFPEDCYICIEDPVFQDCSNLEIIENLSPILKRTEEFLDEDTGETVQIEYDVDIEIHENCFRGCTKLFADQQIVDEDGFVSLPFGDQFFPIGYHESRMRPFYEEMCDLIYDLYEIEKESYPNKSSFTFNKNIIRYNNEYEFLFENGGLYNVTKSSFVMFLPDFSSRELIIPKWVKQLNLLNMNKDRWEKTILDVESLRFTGDTDLESTSGICFSELKTLILSDAQNIIPKGCFCECEKLQEIVFPTSLKHIGSGAFQGCKSLKYLDFPTSLEEIEDAVVFGSGAFADCDVLQSVTFHIGTWLTIGKMNFTGCNGLLYVEFKPHIENQPTCTINESSFCGCTNLKCVDFSGISCDIKRDAFFACSSLQDIKGLPDDYVLYGGGIFRNSRLLTVLNHSELRYIEGAEWLDDTAATRLDVLYLPATIKYIKKQQYEEWDDWEPVYMRAQKIVVPIGFKDYFIKLFMEDWGEPTLGYVDYGKRITHDFVEAFNEKVVEE